jgi:Leucine-rich repeat (LRR) protein
MAWSVTSNAISASVSSGTPIVSASTGLAGGGSVSVSPSPQSISVSGASISSGLGIYAGDPNFLVPGTVIYNVSPSSSGTINIQNLLPYKPLEYAWMASALETGSMSLSIKTSTGYAAVMWWDGSVSVYGSGMASAFMTAQKSVPTSGNWSRSAPKQIYIWPCSPGTAIYSGSITGLSCSSRKLTALSVADCGNLTSLDCSTNVIDYIDLRNCDSLQELFCYGNNIGSLDLSQLPALVSLYCQNNYFTSLSLTTNTKLETLQCDHNELTGLTLTNNTLLQNLYCHDNDMYGLSLSTNTRLKNLNCSSNRILTFSIGTGTAMSGMFGCNLSYNLLDATVLNAFYTALGQVSSGTLFVSGNPGSNGDTPSIATAKGYTVYGT